MTYRLINKEVLRLALPSILANITVPLVGIVDLAITGHLGDASLISGMVIGTMLFDLLYWNMGFLRLSTGGFTAQAFGRGDFAEAIDRLWQGLLTAAGIGLLVFMSQWLLVRGAFAVLNLSEHVQEYAAAYFHIRVWACPAALMLMAFRGWFIGMQNTVATMIIDVYVNLGNAIFSFILAVWCEMGLAGVALGTVIAQWTGLALAGFILVGKYRHLFGLSDLHAVMAPASMRRFFGVSGNHFVRSLCMQVIYTGFTIIATRYGDTQIAVSNIMMKVLLLFSYFLDGFAYAAQALVGRFIGAEDAPSVKRTIRVIFLWALGIGVVSTFIYGSFDRSILLIFTSDADILSAAEPFLVWLLIMPLISCVAFTWDGIFTGALATRQMMITMLITVAGYLTTYFALEPWLGIQALYVAYFVHLFLRSSVESCYFVWGRNWQAYH